jgi:hypothetical protein
MISSGRFWAGMLAGYLLACFFHASVTAKITAGANIMGNAGGFAGGNPGTPEGPGFYR